MARKSVIDISKEIDKVCSEYVGNANHAISRAAKRTAAAAAKDLRKSSPQRPEGGGQYADDWTYMSQYGGATVYNRDNYRLTHLLEHGHRLKRGGRSIGHVDPRIHIAPVQKRAEETFLQLTLKELDKI